MPRASYTQYTVYEECPRQYKLKYIDKVAPPDESIHLIFGTAMHETVQLWLKYRFEGSKKADHFDFSVTLKEWMAKETKSYIREDDDGNKIYPTNPEELQEFYVDGLEILHHLYKYADEFFPTKDHELIGIELPLEMQIKGELKYIGYVDVIIHDKKEDIYYIIDLKTSTRGWSKWQKTDKKKTNQALLYKQFYSDLYDVPLDNIIPKFIILKRKIKEDAPYPIKRLSNFVPSHGKISMSRANESWNKFIEECFDDDGQRRTDKEYPPNPSKSNCRFCLFNNNKDLCPTSYYLEED